MFSDCNGVHGGLGEELEFVIGIISIYKEDTNLVCADNNETNDESDNEVVTLHITNFNEMGWKGTKGRRKSVLLEHNTFHHYCMQIESSRFDCLNCPKESHASTVFVLTLSCIRMSRKCNSNHVSTINNTRKGTTIAMKKQWTGYEMIGFRKPFVQSTHRTSLAWFAQLSL